MNNAVNTTNFQFTSPLGFDLVIPKLPNVSYSLQTCNIPGLSIRPAEFPTPFVKIPLIGDHIQYQQFAATFLVDNQFLNYNELLTWLQAIGKPDNFQQAQTIGANTAFLQAQLEASNKGRYNDIALLVLDGQRTPIVKVTYLNAFPVALSEIKFDTKAKDVVYITCDVTFAYQTFNIKTGNL